MQRVLGKALKESGGVKMNGLQNYLDKEMRIKVWPAKPGVKLKILQYLVTKFNYGVYYTEKEVNQIITEFHSFNDYFLLRRELIEKKLLFRTNDGKRYWRGDLWPELKPIETERLLISDSVEKDVEGLKEIYFSCSYMEQWTGQKHTQDYIEKILLEGDLPPGGNKEFYRVKSIYDKTKFEVIGLLEYYCGYPRADVLWIGSLLIHSNYQRKGYGSEIIEAITTAAEGAGFNRIGIGVHLKNWPAVRFWTKEGYDKITGVYGDTIHQEDTFCFMGLEKALS